MTYLHPPPGDVPVIVTKDVGGYVDQYVAMTRLYAETGREVRLHECRSACTLALSLPNVCVYPDSLLKFHKAYNPLNKVANDEVSDQLMASYPSAVRQRLGELTRSYKVLTGSELIRLGIRDCRGPAGPAYAVARARPKPSAPEPGFFGQVAEVFSSAAAPSAVQVKPQRVQVAAAPAKPEAPAPKPEAAPTAPEPAPDAPTPPVRPADLKPAPAAPPPQVAIAAPPVSPPTLPPSAPTPPASETATDAPAPPARPADLKPTPAAPPPQVAIPAPPVSPSTLPQPAPRATQVRIPHSWERRITGSAPILATTRFMPFPYRLVRKS